MLGIDALGYEPEQKELFMEALDKPQGMLLITGPTGSGKTVSLYTGLKHLKTARIPIFLLRKIQSRLICKGLIRLT